MEGELVVNLVGRYDSNRHLSQKYSDRSIQNVFSSSKAVTSIAMAMLVDRSLIRYDTPVADVWPEFAEHGKV